MEEVKDKIEDSFFKEFILAVVEELLISKKDKYRKYVKEGDIEAALSASTKNFEQLSNLTIFNKLENKRCEGILHAWVYIQNTGDLCGFHTMHNLMCITKLLQSTSKEDILYNFINKNLITEYWTSYKHTLEFLLKNCKFTAENERESLMSLGPLERYQFRFLFNNYPEFITLAKSQKVKTTFELFLFGFDIMQATSIDDIDRLHNIFTEFKQSKEPVCLSLALGITNHWTGFVAHKEEDKVQMIFLDSRNQAHLNVSDENIEEFAHEYNRQREKEGKQKLEGFKWTVFIQSLKDTRKALHIIKDCLTTDSTIYNYHLQTQMNTVLGSYNKFFTFITSGGSEGALYCHDKIASRFKRLTKDILLQKQVLIKLRETLISNDLEQARKLIEIKLMKERRNANQEKKDQEAERDRLNKEDTEDDAKDDAEDDDAKDEENEENECEQAEDSDEENEDASEEWKVCSV